LISIACSTFFGSSSQDKIDGEGALRAEQEGMAYEQVHFARLLAATIQQHWNQQQGLDADTRIQYLTTVSAKIQWIEGVNFSPRAKEYGCNPCFQDSASVAMVTQWLSLTIADEKIGIPQHHASAGGPISPEQVVAMENGTFAQRNESPLGLSGAWIVTTLRYTMVRRNATKSAEFIVTLNNTNDTFNARLMPAEDIITYKAAVESLRRKSNTMQLWLTAAELAGRACWTAKLNDVEQNAWNCAGMCSLCIERDNENCARNSLQLWRIWRYLAKVMPLMTRQRRNGRWKKTKLVFKQLVL
jgi:hypothetical protein